MKYDVPVSDRIKYTDAELISRGICCVNCWSTEGITYHHVVPISIGGRDTLSNIVPLCTKCHQLLHFGKGENGTISHSLATKLGLARAKANGKILGGKKGVKLVTKKSKELKPKILEMSADFYGDMSDSEIIRELKLSRNTYYKYKKQIREDIRNLIEDEGR